MTTETRKETKEELGESLSREKWDAIIIGSGLGSLTVASVLAQMEGWKVLILERHWQAGGFTHVFKRKRKFLWDVGIHYIGQVGKGGDLKNAFDFVTGDKVKWHPMPDDFDHFHFPDGYKFAMRKGVDNIRQDLIKDFPEEQANILQYFKDLKRAIRWFQTSELKKNLPPFLQWFGKLIPNPGKSFALQTVKTYMDSRFQDERIKSVLTGQWGDYGLPPEKAAFVIHAMLTSHYFDGGFYPVGGSGNIFDSIEPILGKSGGRVLVNHRVDEIIIEKNKAVGVRATYTRGRDTNKSQLEFRAPVIISGVGAMITYRDLLPTADKSDSPSAKALAPAALQKVHQYRDGILDFDKRNPNTAHVSLYLGLKESPAKLGVRGENYWLYSSWDHNENYGGRNAWVEPGATAQMAYVSFPSLKDPESEGHTAEIITFVDIEQFAAWADKPWRKRGDDYNDLKDELSNKILDFVEQTHPGFRDLIEYQELSTPLSTVTMTGHHRGGIYGLPGSPERFDPEASPWVRVRTPVNGLYMTGSDALSWGVGGALSAGLLTGLHLVKPWNIPRIQKLLQP
jgi:all-trans-retinol 13,14-reductase